MMKTYKIAVIGQGYVGLPLSLEFAVHYPVLGFDINAERVSQLNQESILLLKLKLKNLMTG